MRETWAIRITDDGQHRQRRGAARPSQKFLGERHDSRSPAASLQPVGQHQHDQCRRDELRQRDADIGHDADQEIGAAWPRPQRRDDAERERERQHQQRSPEQREQQRAAERLQQRRRDRLAGAHRGAEIAAHHAAAASGRYCIHTGVDRGPAGRGIAASASGVAFSPSSITGGVGRQDLR